MIAVWFTAASLLLAQAPPAQTPPAAPVVILPFTVEAASGTSGLAGAPYWFGEAAAIALTDELASAGVPAISRDERMNVYEALQLPVNAPLTRATIIRTGEFVGAAAIVVGEIKLSDRLTVHARVIDLASGRQFADASADGASASFFDLISRVAKSLRANLPAGGAVVPLPQRASVDAFEDYVKGLVAASPEAQVRFLEASLTRAPNEPRTLLALWHARTAQGDHTRALDAAQKISATARESRTARFCAAQSLIALKRFEDAFKTLDALYKEGKSAAVSNALGVLQLRRGGSMQSGTPAYFFNRAVDESLGDPDIAFNLGYAYALSNDPTSAVYWLREAVRRAPADGAAHVVLSALLMTQQKTVEAKRELDLAKLLGAVEGEAAAPTDRIARGLERLQTDLYPSMAHQAMPAQDKEQNAAFYIERGRRLMDDVRDREAMEEFRRAIYVSPYTDVPHLLLGRVLQRTGRLTEAIGEFTLALWCQETADAHAALASAQLAAGKPEIARSEAQRALVLDPANALAKDVLRQLGGEPALLNQEMAHVKIAVTL